MRIAVISFDQEFSKKIKDSLGDEHQVRIYIDSLGMLRDLKEFTPDMVIYDASAGEFAIDDLKFLMTRDKLGNIEFKIFISKLEPINIDELPKKIPKEIYYKEEDNINKLTAKLKSAGLIEEDLTQDLLLNNEMALETEKREKKGTDLYSSISQSSEDTEEDLSTDDIIEKEKTKKVVKTETSSKPPSEELFNEDVPLEEIENILNEFSLREESKEKEEKQEVSENIPIKGERKVKKEDFLADVEGLLTAQSKTKKEKKDEILDKDLTQVEKTKIKRFTVKETTEAQITEEPTIAKAIRKSGSIKLEISISEEEIKRLIVKETVNEMIEELKNDTVLKELIENIQKDFIDRTEKELEGLKEVVKVEVKMKLLKKIEDDLKENVKESIKKDVMEITTKLVKYKLEQIFGK